MANQIFGLWDDGYVFDIYVTHSEFLGNDAFDNPHFNNTYSPIGKLLHDMKYNGHEDNSKLIAQMCVNFLSEWINNLNIDIILPIPPSQVRDIQPIYLITEELSSLLHIPYSTEVLYKTSNVQAKGMKKDHKELGNTITQIKPAKRRCNILIVDDVYDTGSTANECVRTLRNDPLINQIYYFALVQTKTLRR